MVQRTLRFNESPSFEEARAKMVRRLQMLPNAALDVTPEWKMALIRFFGKRIVEVSSDSKAGSVVVQVTYRLFDRTYIDEVIYFTHRVTRTVYV